MDEDILERESYTAAIVPRMGNGNANVITGIRRCGKSSQMKALRRRLSDHNCIYIDMELARNAELRDWRKLLEYVEGCIEDGRENAVFIDEIQDVPQWELAVRDIVARGLCKVFVTGSNANLLSSEYATYLGGRVNTTRMLPLTYRECLAFRERFGGEGDVLERFIRLGGFPIVWKYPKSDDDALLEIGDIVRAVALKDVLGRSPGCSADVLDRVLRTVLSTVGKYSSGTKIFDTLVSSGMRVSAPTVYSVLDRLEAANIVIKAHKYDVRGRRCLTTKYKYYAADLGICHAMLGYDPERMPAYLENAIFTELLSRGFDVYVGDAGGREVDFVARKSGRTVYVQACTGFGSEETARRELGALEAVDDSFPKFVVMPDPGLYAGVTEKGIRIVGLEEFLTSELRRAFD